MSNICSTEVVLTWHWVRVTLHTKADSREGNRIEISHSATGLQHSDRCLLELNNLRLHGIIVCELCGCSGHYCRAS